MFSCPDLTSDFSDLGWGTAILRGMILKSIVAPMNTAHQLMFRMLQYQTFKTICEPGLSMLLKWYQIRSVHCYNKLPRRPEILSPYEGYLWISNLHLKKLFSTTLIQAPGKKMGNNFERVLLSSPVCLIYRKLTILKKYRCVFEELQWYEVSHGGIQFFSNFGLKPQTTLVTSTVCLIHRELTKLQKVDYTDLCKWRISGHVRLAMAEYDSA